MLCLPERNAEWQRKDPTIHIKLYSSPKYSLFSTLTVCKKNEQDEVNSLVLPLHLNTRSNSSLCTVGEGEMRGEFTQHLIQPSQLHSEGEISIA